MKEYPRFYSKTEIGTMGIRAFDFSKNILISYFMTFSKFPFFDSFFSETRKKIPGWEEKKRGII